MPRKKQWQPRPHPHRASGQDRVRVDGRDVYLGPINSEESRKNYAQLLARLASQSPGEKPEKKPRQKCLTVAEVVGRHQTDAEERYDPDGGESVQFRYAVEPLVRLFSDLPVTEFGVGQLD